MITFPFKLASSLEGLKFAALLALAVGSLTASAKPCADILAENKFFPSRYNQEFHSIIQEARAQAGRPLLAYEEQVIVLMSYGVPHKVYLAPLEPIRLSVGDKAVIRAAERMGFVDASLFALKSEEKPMSSIADILGQLSSKRIEYAFEVVEEKDLGDQYNKGPRRGVSAQGHGRALDSHRRELQSREAVLASIALEALRAQGLLAPHQDFVVNNELSSGPQLTAFESRVLGFADLIGRGQGQLERFKTQEEKIFKEKLAMLSSVFNGSQAVALAKFLMSELKTASPTPGGGDPWDEKPWAPGPDSTEPGPSRDEGSDSDTFGGDF